MRYFGARACVPAILALLTIGGQTAYARDQVPTCAAGLDEGAECRVTVAVLKPTQLTFGQIEVDRRAADIRTMSSKDLETYLKKHLALIVVGPGNALYITDGHHLALALAAAQNRATTMLGTIQHDWSGMEQSQFWEAMQNDLLVHLYDEAGQGPLPLDKLPGSLFLLKDDPYRSLAWGVRKANGYDDTNVAFADFIWADFFRTRLTATTIRADFATATTAGVTMAESSAAANLPGYHGE